MSSKKHAIQLVVAGTPEQVPDDDEQVRETKGLPPLTEEGFAQLKLDRFISVAEVAAHVNGNGDAPWGPEQYLEFRKVKLSKIGREVDGEHELCVVCKQDFLPTRRGDLGVFRATQLTKDSLWTVVAMCHHCRGRDADFARVLFSSRARANADMREKNRQRQGLASLKSAFLRF